ncbi:helix-turn-helix domain-containing protein [Microbacterium sp. CJ88]|uniref:helix-turn-helix domain-containing protein n=1 Tax=Microbacterium sp. CJ88 TaxID=3445672 RepID=UPI003F65EFB9
MPHESADPRVVLGRRLAAHREARKLSPAGLSAISELDVTNIRKIEAGGGNPQLLTVLRIAGVLEIDLAELFAGLDPYALPEGVRPTPVSGLPDSYFRRGDRIA